MGRIERPPAGAGRGEAPEDVRGVAREVPLSVEIDLKKIPESIQSLIEKIGVYDVDKATFLTKQLIDMNHDGVMDLLLFQPDF